MTANKQLIRREIIARERDFSAVVVSDPALLDFDQSVGDGRPMWAVDLDIGGNRPVKSVPIKASGSGSRFFAQRGQTVLVRRTALGRLFIIGPATAKSGVLNTKSYSLETGALITADATVFTRVLFPFEFYQGVQAMKGGPAVFFTTGANTITREAQGLNPAGSFVTDGFANGQSIQIGRRSILNAGTTTVTGVTATVLTVAASLLTEGSSGSGLVGVTIGVLGSSEWAAGNFSFPYSRLEDADGNPA